MEILYRIHVSRLAGYSISIVRGNIPVRDQYSAVVWKACKNLIGSL